MKQRFSSLDVKVIAHELQQSLVTLRLSNIYDLSSKILLLKFAKPDNKKQVLIDIGFRCHLTGFSRTTAAAPSAFVARLRKFLRTRRLTAVAQVGTDRILEFKFSDGQYRLFLEFFASGNIILTDADLNILTLSRIVSEGEGQEPQRVGLKYTLENRQNFAGIPDLTKERVKAALEAGVQKAAQAESVPQKIKSKAGTDLRKCLAVSLNELPPVLVDQTLRANSFDTTVNPASVLENDALLDDLLKSLTQARRTVDDITAQNVCKGFIIAKRREGAAERLPSDTAPSQRTDLLYDDFHPFLPQKLKEDPALEILEFEGFNNTVDEFFSSLEGQKLESRLSERQAAAQRKLDAAKNEQEKRIEGLQEAQTLNMRKAAAIETNVERVQEALDAVNGLLAQGMDWVDIGKLVEREKRRHNPVASIIKLPLKLSEGIITLELAEEEDGDDEDDADETDESDSDDDAASPPLKAANTGKFLSIEIHLTMSPWSNAREYYDQRRTAAVKEEKTQLQAARALKNTEAKVNEDLKKGLKQEKALLQPVRKQMWFEKFVWFISSDGYLIIAGKDASQNEMLYRRYLRKGDVYCHADLRGASSVIIKNNPSTPDAPIPPSTLSQAGTLTVCTSDAWDSKAGMGAWWVNADQVSKSAPTGEFLPTGSFMVRGKKNFLPPAQLLLGLGMMFRISEESKAKHVKHRLHSEPHKDNHNQEGPVPGDQVESVDGSENEDEDQHIPADQGMDNDGDEEEEEEEEEEARTRDNPLQTAGNHQDDDNDKDTEDGEDGDLDVVADDVADLDINKDEDEQKRVSEGRDEEEEDDTAGESKAVYAATETSETTVNSAPSALSSMASGSKRQTLKRGQKKKAKKLAQKYKDQDEEDRAAAEALIGAAAGKNRAEVEAKAKVDREAELAAAKERRRAQHQRQQKETAEHEEMRRVMMEEGIEMLEGDEADRLASSIAPDDLVAAPLPGDEIVEIVPVCAPWLALGKCKYKAKLQPGVTKKGKAIKEVLERWKVASTKKGVVDEAARDKERMWPREVELIKALRPEEVINCVPVGKVKVMMAGGTAGGGGAGAGGGGGGGKSSKGQGGKGKRGGKGSKRS